MGGLEEHRRIEEEREDMEMNERANPDLKNNMKYNGRGFPLDNEKSHI